MVKTSISARSPLSPTPSKRNDFIWWQSLLLAIGLYFVILVGSAIALGLVLGFGLGSPRDFRTLSWAVLFAQVFAYASGFGILLPLLPKLAHRSLRELGLRFPTMMDVVWGIAGAVAMVLVVAAAGLIQEKVFHLKADQVAVQWLRATRGPLLAGFAILACIITPPFEELVFRGFIFNALRRYMAPWGAVVISAIFFGAAHMQPGNAGAVVPLAAGGVVLATVYYRTGSLAASMVTHAVFNAATFFAVAVLHQTN
ncbi:MAG TPA: CPBP family intramembrane glutamic endopeptidase [Candidatus Elarobacter sp.]|nr:CPBP family intramembrane glutamic endopeptidase [Candidatus Elarobacter sp.]